MTDTQVADALIGTLINGRYRVRERLARGAMATVYVAQDERLERTVAVKIIHPGRAADPRFVDRFVEEAVAVARLTHPNVVAAYDQGTHSGLPYLVMEFVRGRTLREVLRSRRRLTSLEALAVIEQVLAAIAAAHRAGLLHHDLRPENVLIAQLPSGGSANLVDSVVKVTDFGLAQAAHATIDPNSATHASRSAAGYASPELVAGEPADPRSDVYSAGIMLFEMLTGRLPADPADPAEVARQQLHPDPVPPSRLVAGLPPAVDQLVVRATRRDRGARPSDAGALLHEVQTVREQVAAGAAPPGPRPRPADATVVLSALPAAGSPEQPGGASDRPSWARLPSPRAKPAGGSGPRRAASAAATTTLSAPTGDDYDDSSPARSQRVIIASFLGVLLLLLATGGWWLGFGRWVPAPEVIGLPKAEAIAAAQQQGLRVAYADPLYDDQVAVDHVLAQEPTGRIQRGGTLTLTLSRGPEVFAVPDVVGVGIEVAIRQLESLGLEVVEADRAYSNTVPAERVVSIEPAVGEQVVPGDVVTVTVSKGRAPIDVPALVGLQVEEARNQLAQLGLEVVVEEVEGNAPQGEVVAQDPAPSSGVEPGDTVKLEISQGPPTRPVPDVTGERCQPAAQALTDAGFAVEFGLQERGRVVLQNPSGGTGLPPGSQVTIFCT